MSGKKSRKKNNDGEIDPFAKPMDPSRCITFHLVHRSNEDPLSHEVSKQSSNGPSEWVLEPNISTQEQFDQVQSIFSKSGMQDALPYYLRTDDYNAQLKARNKPSESNPPIANSRFRRFGDSYDLMLNESQAGSSVDTASYLNLGEQNEQDKYRRPMGQGFFISAKYSDDTEDARRTAAYNSLLDPLDEADDDMDDMDDIDDMEDMEDMDIADIDQIDEDAPGYLKDVFEGVDTTDNFDENGEFADYLNILNEMDEMDEVDEKNGLDANGVQTFTLEQLGADTNPNKRASAKPRRTGKKKEKRAWEVSGTLQDDIVFGALGMSQKQFENKKDEFARQQISSFVKPDIAKFNSLSHENLSQHTHATRNDPISAKYDKFLNDFDPAAINPLDDIVEISEHTEDEDGGDDAGQWPQFGDANYPGWSDEEEEEEAEQKPFEYDQNKSLFENQFERMLSDEYDDENIGELDDEVHDLRGERPLYSHFAGYYHKQQVPEEALQAQQAGQMDEEASQAPSHWSQVSASGPAPASVKRTENLRYQYFMYLKKKNKEATKELRKGSKQYILDNLGAEENEIDSDDSDAINKQLEKEFKPRVREKWDVESILSTRTNSENHPNVIKVPNNNMGLIEINNRGIVKNVLKKDVMKQDLLEQVKEEVKEDLEQVWSFGNLNNNDNDKNKNDISNETNNMASEDVSNVKVSGVNDKSGMVENENEMDNVDEEIIFKGRKGESKRQKKLRKRAIKDARKESRKRKKALKIDFKEIEKIERKRNVGAKKTHSDALRM